MADPRKPGREDARGSLIEYDSSKIKTATPSTTVAELNAFMRVFQTCRFLQGLWMDMSGCYCEIHMRTDANNLVTTASTTHLPTQKGTIHMISQLRHEAQSGAIDDLAHVSSLDCLSDCLTKNSADDKYLREAIRTSVLPRADKHKPFRELMSTRHKAYWHVTSELTQWLSENLDSETFRDAVCFLDFRCSKEVANWVQSENKPQEETVAYSCYCLCSEDIPHRNEIQTRPRISRLFLERLAAWFGIIVSWVLMICMFQEQQAKQGERSLHLHSAAVTLQSRPFFTAPLHFCSQHYLCFRSDGAPS